jgi:uncharacterized membrane protein
VISDPLLLFAFLFGVVAFTRWLEQKYAWVEKISSAVVCTLLGILLANVGVIPHSSPAFDGVFTYAIPYAIVLVVMSSDLRELARAGKPMILMFVVASVGSFFGGLGAGVLFTPVVGPETWKLSGAFSGAFAGGGMNFAAVGQGLEVDPSLFAAAAVADNLSTVPYLLFQVAMVGVVGVAFLRRSGVDATAMELEPGQDPTALRQVWTDSPVSITDLSLLAGIPLAALWVARQLGEVVPAFPEVLWLTTLALILAQLSWTRRIRGAEMVSYFALHMFFIVLGAASVISEVFVAGLPIFLFMFAIIGVHVLVAYGVGWLLKIDLPTVSLASQAAVGGPGSALALGMAMGWHKLVMPSVLVGIFGYALGNYLGFACAWLVNAWV